MLVSARPFFINMLRFSKKADYAILLLSYLAQAAADAGPGKRAHADEQSADQHGADEADGLDAVTENPGQALSSAQDLANATGLSPSLTANILKDFARRGILTSVRGASGGYRLDRDPKDLSLREILEVVDGPLHLVDCSDHGESTGSPARSDATPKSMVGADNSGHADSGASGCCHVDICPSRRPLLALQERIFDMLETLPLQDLISQQRARAAGPSACATSTVLPHNV